MSSATNKDLFNLFNCSEEVKVSINITSKELASTPIYRNIAGRNVIKRAFKE